MRIERFDFYSLDDFRTPTPTAEEPALEIVDTDTIEEESIPLTYSQDELDAAKTQAHAQGFAEGKKAGQEEANTESEQRSQHIDRLLEQITTRVDVLFGEHRNYMEEQSQHVGQIVLSIVRKLAGDAIHANPAQPIEQLVRDCLGIIMHKPKALLSVHPDLKDDVETRVKTIVARQDMEGLFIVEGDATLDIPNAKLEWKHGSADYSLEKLWEQIEEKLSSIHFADYLVGHFSPEQAAMDAPTKEKIDATPELSTETAPMAVEIENENAMVTPNEQDNDADEIVSEEETPINERENEE